jgi:hypothetical protein
VVSTLLLRPLLSTATRCRRPGATAGPWDAGFSGWDGLGIARGDRAALSPLLAAARAPPPTRAQRSVAAAARRPARARASF